MAITYHAGRRIQGLTQDTSLDGTNDGCTTGVTGKLGNAWSFDGSNDKVTLTPTFSGKSAFTYSAWINPSSSSNHWAFPFYEGSGENPKVGIGLDYFNSNGLAYFYVSTASHSAISISVSNIPKGSWTHVTGVYDGSASSSDRLKFYINGALVSSTLSGTPPTTIPTLGGDLYLGWYQANYWFNGLMDQTLFYDKALSASEISTIYNSGSGTTTPDTVGLFAHYNFEQTGNTLVNQVTSGDVKPTNVQVGSRFEETDTRKMYHYEEQVPDYDYTMTTDPRTNTFNSSLCTITHANSTLQMNQITNGGAGGSATYIDLGSNLSTKWVMRFKTKQTAYTSYAGNSQFQVGMSSVAPTSTAYQISSSLNWIGIRWYFGTQIWSGGSRVGVEPRINQNAGDNDHNNSTWNGSGNDQRLYGSPREVSDTTTPYYHEIIWNVDTFTYNLYDNANYTGTKLATATMSSSTNTQWVTGTPSSISGLRYFVFKEGGDSSMGVWVNQLDDVEIWDNVTSVPTATHSWSEEGT
mgnify:CR=1 FL=1